MPNFCLCDRSSKRATFDLFHWPGSDWLIEIVISLFAPTASLKNSCGSLLSSVVGPSMTSFQGEWNATTQFVYQPTSHFELSRNTKTLRDFRLSSQPAADVSLSQLRYLFDFADRLGSCHPIFFTPVSARCVGSLWLWSSPACFSKPVILLGYPNYFAQHSPKT